MPLNAVHYVSKRTPYVKIIRANNNPPGKLGSLTICKVVWKDLHDRCLALLAPWIYLNRFILSLTERWTFNTTNNDTRLRCALCTSYYQWLWIHVTHLTHLPLDKMAAISQRIFSDAFLWMYNFVFRSPFYWSLFLRVQLTMTKHWFRQWLGAEWAASDHLNQCWLD